MDGQKKKRLRFASSALAIAASLIASYYFLNLTIYNAWLTGFPQNEPYLDIIKTKIWAFASIFLCFLALTMYLIVAFVKSLMKR